MELGPDVLLCLGILTLAAGFRSTFGFGDALVSIPLLTLVIGTREATPLFSLTSPAVGMFILLQDRQRVDWKAAGSLLGAAVLGVPVGIGLLELAPEAALRSGLGVVLVGIGLFGLFRRQATEPWMKSPHWVWPMGFLSGVGGGALAATGPAAVVYTSGRAMDPATTRATLQGFFLPISTIITLGHGAAGMWDQQMLATAMVALPVMFVAIVVGRWLNQRIPAARFQRALHGILVVLGLLMLV